GITVINAELPTPEEITAAATDLPAVDAIMLVPFSAFDFVQPSIASQLPLSYSFPNVMDLGAFLSYNYTEQGVGSTAARFVDRILKGAKHSELPVEIAPNSLPINMRTADAIGIEIPDEILRQADIIVR